VPTALGARIIDVTGRSWPILISLRMWPDLPVARMAAHPKFEDEYPISRRRAGYKWMVRHHFFRVES
jgi:hypothetical protein